MSGQSLNVNSTLQCPHGGQVQLISSNTSTKGGGGFLVTTADTFTVTGCPFQIPATPPIPSPCIKVQWLVSDMRVKVNGSPTLSQSSTGHCLSAAQVPQGPVSIVNTQAKVKSM
jgi:predicted outer membrane repeat protein